MRVRLGLALGVVILAAATGARADGPPPNAEQTDFAAREHDPGYRAYKANGYEEAAVHFENAFFAAPNPACKRLFKGEGEAETLNKVVYEPVPPLCAAVPTIPTALEAVVAKALERDRSKRFATAAELADALERAARVVGQLGSHRDVAKHLDAAIGTEISQQREVVQRWVALGVGAAVAATQWPRAGAHGRTAANSGRAGACGVDGCRGAAGDFDRALRSGAHGGAHVVDLRDVHAGRQDLGRRRPPADHAQRATRQTAASSRGRAACADDLDSASSARAHAHARRRHLAKPVSLSPARRGCARGWVERGVARLPRRVASPRGREGRACTRRARRTRPRAAELPWPRACSSRFRRRSPMRIAVSCIILGSAVVLPSLAAAAEVPRSINEPPRGPGTERPAGPPQRRVREGVSASANVGSGFSDTYGLGVGARAGWSFPNGIYAGGAIEYFAGHTVNNQMAHATFLGGEVGYEVFLTRDGRWELMPFVFGGPAFVKTVQTAPFIVETQTSFGIQPGLLTQYRFGNAFIGGEVRGMVTPSPAGLALLASAGMSF
jgi:hypothetical protein